MTETTTYKDAGVDKEAGYEAVSLMKQHVKKTLNKNVISDLGGFSGLFSLAGNNMEEPVLVSGTDGVGTKLMIAFKADKHNTIGQDCVAMCVNDILCQGARALFFLDYIALGKLEPHKVAAIVEGVATGCQLAGAALIGGETAEMPGLYQEGHYDLAGFAVGIVDRKKIITGKNIKEGDIILGLASNGLHSNGFSLVRKVFFEKHSYTVDNYIEELGKTLGEELLRPTRIYHNPVYDLIQLFNIKGISHITGGGFYENIPRILPEGFIADITTKYIEKQPIFKVLQDFGKITTQEMFGTFNMGVGMVMVVDKNDADKVTTYLKEHNEKVFHLGEIAKADKSIRISFE